MTASPTPTQELNSWKEIADYLDVTVRTAQRWEEQRGLPVKRSAGARGNISTTVEELEKWKGSGQPSGSPPAARRVSKTTSPQPAGQRPAEPALRLPRRRTLGWIALAAVLLAAGTAAMRHRFFGPGAPAVWTLQDNVLAVKDIDGNVVWRHAFAERLAGSFYWTDDTALPDTVWIGDLDGDGARETLFNFRGAESSALYCFSARGRVRWKFEAPGEVKAGGSAIRGRFHVVNFKVAPLSEGRPNSVVAAVAHAGKWPGQIALLSAAGKIEGNYWHAGHLGFLNLTLAVADLDKDGAAEIYAGGFNSARGQATLVILDPNRMEGASEEADPQYRIEGMSAGRELARIFFGHSCLQQAANDTHNFVGELNFPGNGLRVDTVEAADTPYLGAILYHLDGRHELRHIQYSDLYQAMHNRLMRDGRLDHPFSRADEEERLRPLYSVVRGAR